MEIGIISLIGIFGVLFRPWRLPEWTWAVGAAFILVVFRLVSFSSAMHAIGEGIDVYLFLLGMMLLSEQARLEGLFDWLAGWAKFHANGSSKKLFIFVYAACVLVTVFLSNDATAVVMTPAVFASVKRAGAKPEPHLFACAFVANAASFVLPISNPANLVVFSSQMPRILKWVSLFGLPSSIAIFVTFIVLWVWFLEPLGQPIEKSRTLDQPKLSQSGRLTAWALLAVVLVLLTASLFEWRLGFPTLLAALAAVACVATKKRKGVRRVFSGIAWGVIPLVGGLFVIVEAMSEAGALSVTRRFLESAGQISGVSGKLVASFGVGIASNLINNLPVGLLGGLALHGSGISEAIRNSVLVGVDLGPNLSVTGSLATILWLIALRREGEKFSGFEFFKVGLIAMPLALALSALVS